MEQTGSSITSAPINSICLVPEVSASEASIAGQSAFIQPLGVLKPIDLATIEDQAKATVDGAERSSTRSMKTNSSKRSSKAASTGEPNRRGPPLMKIFPTVTNIHDSPELEEFAALAKGRKDQFYPTKDLIEAFREEPPLFEQNEIVPWGKLSRRQFKNAIKACPHPKDQVCLVCLPGKVCGRHKCSFAECGRLHERSTPCLTDTAGIPYNMIVRPGTVAPRGWGNNDKSSICEMGTDEEQPIKASLPPIANTTRQRRSGIRWGHFKDKSLPNELMRPSTVLSNTDPSILAFVNHLTNEANRKQKSFVQKVEGVPNLSARRSSNIMDPALLTAAGALPTPRVFRLEQVCPASRDIHRQHHGYSNGSKDLAPERTSSRQAMRVYASQIHTFQPQILPTEAGICELPTIPPGKSSPKDSEEIFNSMSEAYNAADSTRSSISAREGSSDKEIGCSNISTRPGSREDAVTLPSHAPDGPLPSVPENRKRLGAASTTPRNPHMSRHRRQRSNGVQPPSPNSLHHKTRRQIGSIDGRIHEQESALLQATRGDARTGAEVTEIALPFRKHHAVRKSLEEDQNYRLKAEKRRRDLRAQQQGIIIPSFPRPPPLRHAQGTISDEREGQSPRSSMTAKSSRYSGYTASSRNSHGSSAATKSVNTVSLIHVVVNQDPQSENYTTGGHSPSLPRSGSKQSHVTSGSSRSNHTNTSSFSSKYSSEDTPLLSDSASGEPRKHSQQHFRSHSSRYSNQTRDSTRHSHPPESDLLLAQAGAVVQLLEPMLARMFEDMRRDTFLGVASTFMDMAHRRSVATDSPSQRDRATANASQEVSNGYHRLSGGGMSGDVENYLRSIGRRPLG